MGGACSMKGRKRNSYRKETTWQTQDVGGWTILKWSLREIG
jgi:hypothetical protein